MALRFLDQDNGDVYIGITRDQWDALWNSLPPAKQYVDKESKVARMGYCGLQRLEPGQPIFFMCPYSEEELRSTTEYSIGFALGEFAGRGIKFEGTVEDRIVELNKEISAITFGGRL